MTSTQTISSSNLLGFKYVLGEDMVGLGMCMTDGHVYALMILRICEMAEPCYSKGNARPDSTNLTVRDTHLKNDLKYFQRAKENATDKTHGQCGKKSEKKDVENRRPRPLMSAVPQPLTSNSRD